MVVMVNGEQIHGSDWKRQADGDDTRYDRGVDRTIDKVPSST